jgi:hypothetical protein
MPCWSWQLLSSHGRHGAPIPAPPHRTISQHAGWPLCTAALGVGHHGGRRWPFRSRRDNGRWGLLWVVSYVGICRVMYQTTGDAFLTMWGRASPPALEPSAQQPLHQIGCYAVLSGKGHHGEMIRGSCGGKIGMVHASVGQKLLKHYKIKSFLRDQ